MAIIRCAAQADLREILQIYAPFVTGTTISFEYEVPTEDAFRQRFLQLTAQFPWLACEIDGALAGYAYASPAFSRAAYQWDCDLSVYVGPDFQRRGIASAMYGALEELLRLQGYYNIYAIITGGNQNSLAFHQSLGYSHMTTMPGCGYKFGQWLDVDWYHKRLRPLEEKVAPPAPFPALEQEAVQDILRRWEAKIHPERSKS